MKLNSVAANIVKEQFALSSYGMDTARHGDNLIIETAARFGDGVEFGDVIGKTVRDDEFVRVGVFPFGFDAGHLGLAVGLVLGGVDVFIFLRGLFLGGAFGGFFGSLVETFVSEKKCQ